MNAMNDMLTLAELRYSLEAAAEHLMRLHGRFPDDTPTTVAFNVGQALGLLHKAMAAIPSGSTRDDDGSGGREAPPVGMVVAHDAG